MCPSLPIIECISPLKWQYSLSCAVFHNRLPGLVKHLSYLCRFSTQNQVRIWHYIFQGRTSRRHLRHSLSSRRHTLRQRNDKQFDLHDQFNIVDKRIINGVLCYAHTQRIDAFVHCVRSANRVLLKYQLCEILHPVVLNIGYIDFCYFQDLLTSISITYCDLLISTNKLCNAFVAEL